MKRCFDENGVLIRKEAGYGAHHHSAKEIQQLNIDQTIVEEETKITIKKVDGGKFILNLLNPTSKPKPTYWASGSISANATAAQLRGALFPYYSKYFKSNISVTLVMKDKNGVETTDKKLSYSSEYTVKLLKMINGVSASNIIVVKKGTKATITAKAAVVKSSVPLTGNYLIQCTDSKGVEYKTPEMKFNSPHSTV